jgi:CRP-like cAMP-binding protein
MTPEDERTALASPILTLMPSGAATGLLAVARVRSLRAGERLFEQDDPAADAFVVLEGWIAVLRRDAEGRQTVVEVFTRADSFAETPALIGEAYPVAAEAATRARVLAVPGAALRNAAVASPETALAMIAAGFQHMRRLLGQIKQLKARTAPQRLARFLVDLAGQPAGAAALELPFDKTLIAARIGVTPSSLSRAFRHLRAVGVRVEQNRAQIADLGQLRAFSDARDR